MTYYDNSLAPEARTGRRSFWLAVALLGLLTLAVVMSIKPRAAPPAGGGEIVISGQDWHGNVRRSDR